MVFNICIWFKDVCKQNNKTGKEMCWDQFPQMPWNFVYSKMPEDPASKLIITVTERGVLIQCKT